MKPIVYLFGTLPSGFASYPRDYTRDFLEAFLKKSKNVVQVAVLRKDNLLYYGYVRKFHNGKFFGVCVCMDRIYKDMARMFNVMDDIYAEMVKRGDLLKIMPQSMNVAWAVNDFAAESVSINEYGKKIVDGLDASEANTLALPPVDFSISINDCMELSLERQQEEIVDAIKRYSSLYIVKTNAEIERVTGFFITIRKKDDEIKKLKDIIHNLNREITGREKTIDDVSRRLTKAKTRQRNTVLVGVLGAIILVFGFIIWNKVLFPSEVTHYETGEFVYYGPLKDSKPNGTGVAIYPHDDKDGRKYYIGNFVNGERQDTAAILFYQDGDYYYGAMKNDQWDKGILYMNSDNSHFTGEFKNNEPYDGIWYDHEERYKLISGEKSY